MIKVPFIFIISIALIACSCSQKTELSSEEKEQDLILVQQYMDEQISCWNNGDIPCFMEHYWHSDSLLFIGSKGVTYGWQSTLDNYLESYPDKKNMGILNFDNQIVRHLDDQTIQVIGAWTLDRGEELNDLGGHYSLIWQKKEDKWVIISDHSS